MRGGPNAEKVERLARELGSLMDQLVLVGGCAVGLLVTQETGDTPRATLDIDVVVEAAPTREYYAFCERIKAVGFREDQASDVLCRWRKDDLILDLMPVDEDVLSFTNSWYGEAVRGATLHPLSASTAVRLVSAPVFIATKLESFRGRGGGDYLHHDIEDIVTVIEGRPELVEEAARAHPEVQEFLRDEFDALIADPTFFEQIDWQLGQSVARAERVASRLRALAGL